ncbi:MAG: hypothetical protein HFJ33_04030 [Clostridia bacterium]|nr:hypothetical protein [Clostridia bacterium]
MKKGLIIGIIIAVIVLAVAGVGGYFVFNDVMQKNKIMETFSELEQVTKSGNFDQETINEKTSNIVSTGKYANVEKAGKNYARDLFSTAIELKTMLEDEKMAQLLTASNYQNDGPEFAESKKYITETKQKLEDGKAKMLSFLEEGKINSYIEAETSDEYCKELYRQLLAEDINMPESEKKQVETSIDKVVSMLGIAEEVINFLIENNGKWEVEGEQILFNSNALVVKYNSFLTRLRMV